MNMKLDDPFIIALLSATRNKERLIRPPCVCLQGLSVPEPFVEF